MLAALGVHYKAVRSAGQLSSSTTGRDGSGHFHPKMWQEPVEVTQYENKTKPPVRGVLQGRLQNFHGLKDSRRLRGRQGSCVLRGLGLGCVVGARSSERCLPNVGQGWAPRAGLRHGGLRGSLCFSHPGVLGCTWTPRLVPAQKFKKMRVFLAGANPPSSSSPLQLKSFQLAEWVICIK